MINYKEFYREFHPKKPMNDMHYGVSPTISLFYQERKKLVLKEFKKFRAKKRRVRVLDVGCGGGGLIYSLYDFSRKDDFFKGIDINKTLVKMAEELKKNLGIKNLEFKRIDISEETWSDSIKGKFDIVILSEVIEHLYKEDQENVLRNVENKLSNEGILIITCPNKNCLIKKLIRIGKRTPFIKKKINIELIGIEGHVNELTYSQLRTKTKKYFEIIRQGGMNFSYGSVQIDKSTLLLLFFIISNAIFRKILKSFCFDQYIILKSKRSKKILS